MSGKSFKGNLRSGNLLIGSLLYVASPSLVEMMGLSGFDFLIIDTEHNPTSLETIETLVRACELVHVFPLVRVAEDNLFMIGRSLDIGAKGVVISRVRTKDDVAQVVEATKYFPEGHRGACGISRAGNYSLALKDKDFFTRVNEETVVMALVETVDAVKNIDEILQIKGLDAVLSGPGDLSQEMGVHMKHPRVLKKIEEVWRKTKKTDVAFVAYCGDRSTANEWIEMGVTSLCFSDVRILMSAFQHFASKS